MTVNQLAQALLQSRGFAHKRDIGSVIASLAEALPPETGEQAQAVGLGDDCAAIADGNGFTLFAIEGLVSDFIDAMPWFAGYCSVMVNVSDIYAMGGRPVAVVDAFWSNGGAAGQEVLRGMAAAAKVYGVPISGGHANARSDANQLAVAILGRATRLLTSFAARPGDALVMAVDLRGEFREPFPYWDASSHAPSDRLRADLELLPRLAECGLCEAAKDISMAGSIGTAMMLLECSGAGAIIDVDAIPVPAGVPQLRWLTSFPSFGFILSVRRSVLGQVMQLFHERAIACAQIGWVNDSRRVALRRGEDCAELWDFEAAGFIGARLARSSQHA